MNLDWLNEFKAAIEAVEKKWDIGELSPEDFISRYIAVTNDLIARLLQEQYAYWDRIGVLPYWQKQREQWDKEAAELLGESEHGG